jgi:hypothetical protein
MRINIFILSTLTRKFWRVALFIISLYFLRVYSGFVHDNWLIYVKKLYKLLEAIYTIVKEWVNKVKSLINIEMEKFLLNSNIFDVDETLENEFISSIKEKLLEKLEELEYNKYNKKSHFSLKEVNSNNIIAQQKILKSVTMSQKMEQILKIFEERDELLQFNDILNKRKNKVDFNVLYEFIHLNTLSGLIKKQTFEKYIHLNKDLENKYSSMKQKERERWLEPPKTIDKVVNSDTTDVTKDKVKEDKVKEHTDNNFIREPTINPLTESEDVFAWFSCPLCNNRSYCLSCRGRVKFVKRFATNDHSLS